MNRTIVLHVDLLSGLLLDPVSWFALNEVPTVKRGDTISFELHFYRRVSGEFADAPLSEVGSYFVGMKVRGEFYAVRYLAQTEDIAIDDAALTFTLALTSAELVSRLAGNKERVEAVLEIPYTGEAGESTIASFRLDVLNDYVKGNEGDPAPDVPTYYTAAQVAALFIPKTGDGEKIVTASDGKQRIAYLFPDDVWRVPLPVIVDDEPTLTWEETE